MTVILGKLEGEARKSLASMCEAMFLDGECYAFAIALHRGLERPMIGLMQDGIIRHVLIHLGADMLADCRGQISSLDKELGKPFGIMLKEYRFQKVTEADLFRQHPIGDLSIRRAMLFAEALWPDLPWIDGLKNRALAFAKDLEVLSRKHKMWIRDVMPTCPPMLAEGMDDEGGYMVKPSDDGSAYAITRFFPGQEKYTL